ncbi:MAG TPA: hypothetical protein VFN10_22325 [Thermoanaerobaculia bacterium]|nr:hypothetical protein [Thermoanaerobaculia bacterium]
MSSRAAVFCAYSANEIIEDAARYEPTILLRPQQRELIKGGR